MAMRDTIYIDPKCLATESMADRTRGSSPLLVFGRKLRGMSVIYSVEHYIYKQVKGNIPPTFLRNVAGGMIS